MTRTMTRPTSENDLVRKYDASIDRLIRGDGLDDELRSALESNEALRAVVDERFRAHAQELIKVVKAVHELARSNAAQERHEMVNASAAGLSSAV